MVHPLNYCLYSSLCGLPSHSMLCPSSCPDPTALKSQRDGQGPVHSRERPCKIEIVDVPDLARYVGWQAFEGTAVEDPLGF